MDKPQYTSIPPLEELRRIEAEVEHARSVDDLRLLFDRLSSLRRAHVDHFDARRAIEDVQQTIIDRSREFENHPFEPRHTPPPQPARQTADVFLRETPEPEGPAPEPPSEEERPDIQAIDARTWKRATYIGIFIALIVLSVIFYLVQTARRLNFEPAQEQGANQAKTNAGQQKPAPGTPAGAQPTPVSTNPALRLYTDLVPGTVQVDGGAARPLQDGELQLDALTPGQHSVKLAGRTGTADVAFNSAEKSAPKLSGPPAGDNAMVVTVSTQDGQGQLMTNAQNSVAILDGKELGPIPPSGLALTNLGQTDHDLQVRQGTDSQRFVLTYVPSPALTVFVKNDLNAGNLVILTGEDGADVYINNQKYKRRTDHGQLRLPDLKVGTYSIKVAKPGFVNPPAQTVDIKKGEEAKLTFHLEAAPQPQPASLEVSGAPVGTQILIDGTLAATTDQNGGAKIPTVVAGNHKIELKHDGFESKQLQLDFTAGQTLALTGADVALSKVPEQAPAPPPPAPAEQKEAPSAMAAAESDSSTMPASIHRGGGFLIYHSTKAPGHYVFTLQLRRGGGFLKSRHLQWFVGYQDMKNYLLFQVDGKHFTVRQVVDGKGDELRKVPFDANPEGYIQIDMAVKAHSVDTRLRPNDGGWEDMGTVADTASDLTQGKFGVLISGNDEIGVSTVHYGK